MIYTKCFFSFSWFLLLKYCYVFLFSFFGALAIVFLYLAFLFLISYFNFMSSFQNKILLCIHYRSGLCVPWECRTVGAPWAVTRPCTRARWSAGQGSPPPAHRTGSRSCTPQFTSTVYSTPGGIQLTVQAHVPAHHSTPVQYTVHQGVYSPQYRLTFLHTTVHQWGIISF